MSKTNKHPYIGSSGILTQVFNTFRSNFPSKVDSATLQKLALAPNNESVVITTLKFLGFLDEKGAKQSIAGEVFLKHNDDEFQKALKKVVQKAYKELFELHGEKSWTLDKDQLINFFRVADETSQLTATRQAGTFETLSALSGQTTINVTPKKKISSKQTPKAKPQKSSSSNNASKTNDTLIQKEINDLGLTVRIEINLPAQGDQETYDRIFQSIRKNLLNK